MPEFDPRNGLCLFFVIFFFFSDEDKKKRNKKNELKLPCDDEIEKSQQKNE